MWRHVCVGGCSGGGGAQTLRFSESTVAELYSDATRNDFKPKALIEKLLLMRLEDRCVCSLSVYNTGAKIVQEPLFIYIHV